MQDKMCCKKLTFGKAANEITPETRQPKYCSIRNKLKCHMAYNFYPPPTHTHNTVLMFFGNVLSFDSGMQ